MSDFEEKKIEDKIKIIYDDNTQRIIPWHRHILIKILILFPLLLVVLGLTKFNAINSLKLFFTYLAFALLFISLGVLIYWIMLSREKDKF